MDITTKFYEILQTHPFSFQRYGWESQYTQEQRFRVLLPFLSDLCTILDLGCGEGDLYVFLKQNNIDIDYTGIDILPFMIEKASRKYPSVKWLVGSIDSSKLDAEHFDIIFASGVYNIRIDDNYAFLKQHVARALEISDAFLVNLLSESSPNKEPKHFFYYSKKMIAKLFSDYSIQYFENYLPNDISLYITK